MGFNTAVVILNDEIHRIAEDKDFGKKLADAILTMPGKACGEIVRIGHYSSHVVASAHMDLHQVIEVHGNLGTVMKTPRNKLKPVKP
jgi:hypothetical protein